ncbi:spore germination protein [Kyrpidia tusciae]|uniref:GerA spore germination protein n=1 Tax=Kyrpidia tusciae (strain DSM 2912 / NBRC 15312 / T2) TaxID=562970 RepID=D5WVF2_KYRT2|nr:spore germination protein [Kyrpidia tusciae]ADG05562.1 GerA spore germination protein [Kyrpidia tusciae DSM 2912]
MSNPSDQKGSKKGWGPATSRRKNASFRHPLPLLGRGRAARSPGPKASARPQGSESPNTGSSSGGDRSEDRSLQSTAPKSADSLLGDVSGAVQWMRDTLGQSDDFVVRGFSVFGRFPAALFFFSAMVELTVVNEDILRPLMAGPAHPRHRELSPPELKKILLDETIYHCETQLEPDPQKVQEAVLRGETAIVVEGMDEAILIDTRTIEKRSVDQPETEQVIRGARDGFIELISTNISLLRYRLQTPDFRVKMIQLGRESKIKTAVCYIEGVVNPELVKEVWERMSKITIDAVEAAGYIEQLIEDHHTSPFPQVQNTERPDKAVASLLEGRVVILTDGTPFALIVPAVFAQFLQTIDDYSERFLMASMVRTIRFVALIFSLIFPSLYVSLISYNPELIPTRFAVAVAGGRAGVPFPAVIEVLIMEIAIEVLREATIRMPEQVGGALSIVGALVIGQAAVSAGFASPITVVVVALTTIGSFATPAYSAAVALRMLRFPLTILAGMFGLYGVMIGLIAISNHLLSLRSFGVPYFSPLVPTDWQGIKDTLLRSPLWTLTKRPAHLFTRNPTRVGKKTIQAMMRPTGSPLQPSKYVKKEGGAGAGSKADHHNPSDGGGH